MRGGAWRRPGLLAAIAATAGTIALGWQIGERFYLFGGVSRAKGEIVEVTTEWRPLCWDWRFDGLVWGLCHVYTARVRFALEDGRTIEFAADAGRSMRRATSGPRYSVHDVVAVAHDPDSPSRAAIDERVHFWRSPVPGLAFAVIVAWFAAFLYPWAVEDAHDSDDR